MRRAWLLRLNRLRLPLIEGTLLSVTLALAILFPPFAGVEQLRERVFDTLIQLKPAAPAPEIVVVDIDARSDGEGDAAWSRFKTAALVEKLAEAGAAVVAFDLVFSAFCDPALPENTALTAALGKLPVVLGFLLSDRQSEAPAPQPPVLFRQPVLVPGLWVAVGAERSCSFFEAVAKSSGLVSLAGDSDARIRLAPGVVVVTHALYPGLALEAVRLGKALPPPIFGGSPVSYTLGSLTLPLDDGANLRFRASNRAEWETRTLSASDVVAGQQAARLARSIVFVGSSQPELGGLRATASDPLQPSVQIHADIAAAVLGGSPPYRDPLSRPIEALVAGLGGLLAMAIALWRPSYALAAAAGLAVAWAGAATGIFWFASRLIDPLYPAVTIVAAYALTSLMHYAATRRAEQTLRWRFGQRLPPVIVSRFVENPALLRLEGEERIVTSLFTDIEGFSTMTQRAGPRELISVLDRYLGGITRIVTAHGGTVDKFVGDAVHAFFNAPLDLEGHTDKAIAAAREILAFTEELRQLPDVAGIGLGRTRIGIETGVTVVGDVGSGGKIDYTAYGNAVNLASRLEGANKQLGTSICIGPGARANASTALSSLGEVEIRGFGKVEVFAPQAPTEA